METSSIEPTTVGTERRMLNGEPLTPADITYLFGLYDRDQRRQTAAPGRSEGAAKRNKEQSRVYRDKIKRAAELISFYDIPPRERVKELREFLLWRGPEAFGLSGIPDDKTLRAVITELVKD